MPQDHLEVRPPPPLERTVVTQPGAVVEAVVIQMPTAVREAIAVNLAVGVRVRAEGQKVVPSTTK